MSNDIINLLRLTFSNVITGDIFHLLQYKICTVTLTLNALSCECTFYYFHIHYIKKIIRNKSFKPPKLVRSYTVTGYSKIYMENILFWKIMYCFCLRAAERYSNKIVILTALPMDELFLQVSGTGIK